MPSIGASFTVAFDPLTGFFLLPIYGLSAVCAVFGAGYLSHAHHGRGVAAHWLFYGLLVASMALVVMARNAVLFLVAWEIMSLSSWQLVTFEHEREETRQAGITYLVATQIGTAFLLVMFLVLGAGSGAGAGRPAAPSISRTSPRRGRRPPPSSSWPSSGSARRRASFRCTSGFPRRTPRHLRT